MAKDTAEGVHQEQAICSATFRSILTYGALALLDETSTARDITCAPL